MSNYTWGDAIISISVFLVALIALFWLRKYAYDRLARLAQATKTHWDDIIVQATRGPSSLWCLLISAVLALAVSDLSHTWEDRFEKILWTIFALSVSLALYNIANGAIQYYEKKYKMPRGSARTIRTAVVIVIIPILTLGVLEIWGVPTSYLLVLIIVGVVVAALALRDTIPSLFAGLQLGATGHIKAGDYIKLDTGQEGYITEIGWRNTHLEALDGTSVLVPNSHLVQSTVVNYGKPVKKAKTPFQFSTRMHLKELTGVQARNLRELAAALEKAPDSVIYYHTHSFLEEHHYLTPEPANDFALWVTDALNDEILGERLAVVDTFEFSSLGALRERLVNIIQEHLTKEPDLSYTHDVYEGREFHFIKSVSVILETPYIAHDMREFVESLRKVSLGCLYYHIFESRLRLGQGLNDFSIWLEQSLEEKELAEQIAHLDPYTYTLEGLRSSLIQLIEKRIK